MKSKLVAILTMLIFTSLGQAGTEGHGGGGMVCRDRAGNVTSVELLDLWEANLRPRYQKIPRSDLAVEEQVKFALGRLHSIKESFAKEVKDELLYLQGLSNQGEVIQEVPKEIKIEPPSDAFADLTKNGCDLEGVATYWDTWSVLWLDMELFNTMISKTDKAALFLHEAIYKVRRSSYLREKNSQNTRRIIAILFSAEDDFERDIDLLKEILK